MIHIAGRTYEVLIDHKNGWRPEAFRDRYSEVLDRYDYIVGDWGYSQLRLRGFFKDTHPKATKDSMFSTLQDYLNEYCNFGCAYFIIEKVPNKQGEHGELLPISEDDLMLDVELPQEQPAAVHASAVPARSHEGRHAGGQASHGGGASSGQQKSQGGERHERHGQQSHAQQGGRGEGGGGGGHRGSGHKTHHRSHQGQSQKPHQGGSSGGRHHKPHQNQGQGQGQNQSQGQGSSKPKHSSPSA
ncbi:YutD family protein [Paenibacillus cremeus]|uniref:DUF1027 domain-containing protein n=1 Tax=Paenibacillus cremeus TaxID=2163881 RepID=A0A559KBB6_9BACL|nr:YutD family protein [Paenibacillus cremeus]TVY09420.1 DUF1027 domain-containing protein [Paenibacillus cremeus]